MPNLKKVGMLSAAAFLAQLVANWIYSLGILSQYINKTQQLFSITPTTGIGGQKLGMNILSYIPMIPDSITGWIAYFIGVFAIVYIGFYIYESKIGKKINMDRNMLQKTITILLYGHVVLYALFLILGWGVSGIGVSLLVGLAVNLLIVSALVVTMAKYAKWPKV